MKKIAAALALAAILAVLGIGGTAHMAAAQTTVGPIEPVNPPGGCGGNTTIRTVPIDCANKRQYTISGVTFTVFVRLQVDATGNGTASYTLSRRLPQPVPIRVRAHVGVSSNPVLTSDVSGSIPAGSQTGVLTFRVVCGQVDAKAVFTGNGDEDGRIAGPYLCIATPPTVPTTAPTTTAAPTTTTGGTTVPTTGPTTGPDTTPGPSTSSPGTPAPGPSSTPSSGPGASNRRIPATGFGDVFGWLILTGLVLVLGVGGIVSATRRQANR
jgi:hypothetical protein